MPLFDTAFFKCIVFTDLLDYHLPYLNDMVLLETLKMKVGHILRFL